MPLRGCVVPVSNAHYCLNGRCGRCRCDHINISGSSFVTKVSMASAAGVAATVGRMGVVCEAPVSMASAAGVSGTYRLKPEPRVVWSQWLLQPVTTRNHRGKGNKRTTKKRREKRKRCLNGLCGHSNGTLRNEACRSQRRTCCQRTTRALFMRTVMQPGLRALPFPCAGRRRTSAAS